MGFKLSAGRRWRLTVLGALAVVVATAALAWSLPRHAQRIMMGALVALSRGEPWSYPELAPREEFRRVAQALRASDNRFHGRKPIAELTAALEHDPPRARVEHLAELADHQLRVDSPQAAAATIDEALALVDADITLGELRARVDRMGVLVHLRLAEQLNCVDGHCAQSCIFPISEGGRHGRREPAERCRALLERYLAADPPDALGMGWVLNIVNMVLDDYPERVPEAYRVPAISAAESAAAGETVPRLVDAAARCGVDRLSIAGGVAVADFDGDGLLDLLSSSSDPEGPLMLFRNLGDGRFADLAPQAGLAEQLGGLQCQAVDYDADGDLDIFVLRGAWFGWQGRIRNSLLRREADGRYTDVTRAAGLAEPAYPTQVGVWGDFNGDGHVDLFVGNESLDAYIGLGQATYPSQLYFNNGDGTFTERGAWAGVDRPGWVKGAAAADFDADGDLDLYVSIHGLDRDGSGANRLYRNDGSGRFVDVAEELGVSQPDQSFAVFWFDYDNDGWLDLLVAAYPFGFEPEMLGQFVADWRGQSSDAPKPRLYRNRRGQGFDDVTGSSRLDHVYYAMGATYGDFDGDGYLDVYLGTGAPHYESLVPNVLLRNVGGRHFADVTAAAGVGSLQKGHGAALADLDNDGDLDLYADLGGFYPADRFTNALFLNPGARRSFVYLDLVAAGGGRTVVGARVQVDLRSPGGSRALYRWSGQPGSFGGNPERLEIPFRPDETLERITVTWPAEKNHPRAERRQSRVQTIQSPPAGAWLLIVEGQHSAQSLPLATVALEAPAGEPARDSDHTGRHHAPHGHHEPQEDGSEAKRTAPHDTQAAGDAPHDGSPHSHSAHDRAAQGDGARGEDP